MQNFPRISGNTRKFCSPNFSSTTVEHVEVLRTVVELLNLDLRKKPVILAKSTLGDERADLRFGLHTAWDKIIFEISNENNDL